MAPAPRGARPQSRPDQDGFTLVEVLVALAILGGSLATVMGIISINSARLATIADRTAAAALARSLLAEAGTTLALDGEGQVEPGLRWRLHSEPYGSDADRQAWPIEARIVTVTVWWKKETLSLTTLQLVGR